LGIGDYTGASKAAANGPRSAAAGAVKIIQIVALDRADHRMPTRRAAR